MIDILVVNTCERRIATPYPSSRTHSIGDIDEFRRVHLVEVMEKVTFNKFGMYL